MLRHGFHDAEMELNSDVHLPIVLSPFTQGSNLSFQALSQYQEEIYTEEVERSAWHNLR